MWVQHHCGEYKSLFCNKLSTLILPSHWSYMKKQVMGGGVAETETPIVLLEDSTINMIWSSYFKVKMLHDDALTLQAAILKNVYIHFSGNGAWIQWRFYMGAYRGQCPCKNVPGPRCGPSWADWIIKLKQKKLIELSRFYALAPKAELVWFSIPHGLIRATHPNTALPGARWEWERQQQVLKRGDANV